MWQARCWELLGDITMRIGIDGCEASEGKIALRMNIGGGDRRAVIFTVEDTSKLIAMLKAARDNAQRQRHGIGEITRPR